VCVDADLLSVVDRVECGVQGIGFRDLDDGFTDGLCV